MLVVLGVLVVALAIAACTIDRWLMTVMSPGAFDAAAVPTAPDYADPSSWAALPDVEDGADVALPELPAIDQTEARAAVFYVHPTTFLGPGWNGPIDDPAVMQATARGGTLIQASAFNACCAVYAPRYRQAHGHAFVRPDAEGERALEIAYQDVSAAFDAFMSRTGELPFIVAGHSQGAVLAARLLRERIVGRDIAKRFVAAYLPGAPLRADDLGVPVCESATQTGCVASWHARGPGYQVNGLEFDAANPDTMRDRICVNPITWATDDAHAPAESNAGAIFFDTASPVLEPAFADARCHEGTLLVTTHGDFQRDLMSKILLWIMGPENYHPLEYQLFYVDLRNNAVARVEAFAAQ